MTYQTIYSSSSTIPMQSDDLEQLLENARSRNGAQGISGALVYTDMMFLKILEGEREKVQALMARIVKDVRHENVIILREGDTPIARFSSWGMAYVSATPEEAAKWAGVGIDTGECEVVNDADQNLDRTARFVQDILTMLTPEKSGGTVQEEQGLERKTDVT